MVLFLMRTIPHTRTSARWYNTDIKLLVSYKSSVLTVGTSVVFKIRLQRYYFFLIYASVSINNFFLSFRTTNSLQNRSYLQHENDLFDLLKSNKRQPYPLLDYRLNKGV